MQRHDKSKAIALDSPRHEIKDISSNLQDELLRFGLNRDEILVCCTMVAGFLFEVQLTMISP